jgi:transcriptional regulator with XRE-family HTH domain
MIKSKHHFTPGDLRTMRKHHGLTQESTAARMGVSISTVSMIESGKNSNPITIALYLRVLQAASGADVAPEARKMYSLECVVAAAGFGVVFGSLVLAGVTSLFF